MAAVSVLDSLRPRLERVEVELGSEVPSGLTRLPDRRARSRVRPDEAGR